MVKQPAIGDLAHAMEEVLSPFRENLNGLGKPEIDKALGILDEIRVLLGRLDQPPPAPAADTAPKKAAVHSAPHDERALAVHLETEEIDRLLESLIEANAATTRLRMDDQPLTELLGRSAALLQRIQIETNGNNAPGYQDEIGEMRATLMDFQRRYRNGTERVNRELERMREIAAELRLQPAELLVNELQRTVRDAATQLNRTISVQTSGTDIRIDAEVLAGIRGALRHLVRNSAVHGIEAISEEP